MQIRDFLKNMGLVEDRVVLEKWIHLLVAERLNAPLVEPYIISDNRASKKPRGSIEQFHVLPDSLKSPFVHNMPLDIEE